jgi:hypothetical protein
VETFLRCRGSIKEVEKALGVSYPTVRNMLESALTALGLNDKGAAAAATTATTVRREEKQDVLDRLSCGELSAEEAIAALKEINKP